MVHRERLFKRLDSTSALTVVRGPAGFGKTTLLADWIGRREHPALWIRLPDDAAVPPRETIFAILAGVLGSFATSTDTSTTAVTDGANSEEFVFEHAALLTTPLTVVIDRYERNVDPALDELLVNLLQALSKLNLVVVGRALSRLESIGPLYVDTSIIGPADLAFTADEVELLTDASGGHPSREQSATVHAALAGWPAATRVVIDDLAEHSEANTSVGLTAIKHGLALPSYLLDQTLAEIDSEDMHDVLVACSVIEHLTTEMVLIADPNCKPDNTLELLHELGYAYPAPDETPGYRMIPALRRALRARFEHQQPVTIQEIELRVAAWYRRHGDPGAALGHAVRARDWAMAVDIIADDWLSLADSPTGLTRLAPDNRDLTAVTLPHDAEALAQLAKSPFVDEILSLATVQSLVLRVSGELRPAARLTSTIEAIARSAARGGWETRRPDVAGTLAMQWGLTHLLAGEIYSALNVFDHAFALHLEAGNHGLAVQDAGAAALTLVLAGEPVLARTWLETKQTADADAAPVADHLRTTGRAARVLMSLESLDRERAERAAAALGDIRRKDELWFATALALGEYALTYGGEYDEALRQLQEIRALQHPSTGTGSIAAPLVATAIANLLMASGRGNAASAVLSEVGDGYAYTAVASARLAALSGTPDRALRLASRELRKLGTSPWLRVSMGSIRALAHLREGHPDQASSALRAAIDVAERTGLLRPFAAIPRDELEQIATTAQGGPALLKRLDEVAAPQLFPAQLHVAELTRRERIVLGALASGLTLQDIAADLFVSTNTVKTQVRAVYQKLGVHSRAEAILRGHEWGLIAPRPDMF
jgi:LuxR family maltose regulon positive regulatory protein